MLETGLLELYKILLVFISIFIFVPVLPAQNYPDREVDSLLKSGIGNIISDNYTKAAATFGVLQNNYPNLPLGKIYLAAVKIAKAYDLAENFDDRFINKNLEAAVEQSEELINKDKNNIWYRYFYALSTGYKAYFEVLNKDWLPAFTNGLNSVSDLERCLKMNPGFYEAYTALGTFKYWKSRKTELISWLPFIKDEREEGIKQLRIAADSSSYNKYLAMNSLIWVYIDKGEYNNAVTVALSALKKFPGSRLFMWGLARAYENTDEEKSVKVYSQILDSYRAENCLNDYNEILIKHIIAQQYSKIGNTQKALVLCDEILAVKNIPDFILKKLGNRIERVRELREQLRGELSNQHR